MSPVANPGDTHPTRRRRPWVVLAAALGVLALLGSACSSDDTATASASDADGDAPTIGFLFVGPKDDFGYNQAAYEGSVAVEEAFPDATILRAENVPETAEAEQVMEEMINQGADIIFPTSYGHMEFANNVAALHPDVTIVHQGGLEPEPGLDNFGTYFGTVYEPVYTAGIAAGAATETGKLGYVYAFPIPQTLSNINAFTLGAQSVNPEIEVIAVSTGSWCDPGLQAQAASSLLNQGVDVLTQHQDCTKTIIETADAAGAMTVGYHFDASELTPEGWITGSEWDWGPLYVEIVQTILDGAFVDSDFNGDFRVGLQTGSNPFVQSAYGPMVDEDTQALVDEARQRFIDGGSPFAGPVVDQDGEVVWAEGEQPTYAEVEQMDFFVQGVTGRTS
ncbi:BMP family ABC transporter substrate-binding protein [Rhabdothermincola salaria]|uniref:BMP family ABC transporter substrate-binding protein n=1 Tax=Rhabdothermincola salaria TaxID=2903142 RepID=UPI001E56BB2E|nr:BMP family ABC transporter substrate-binding protein [Rhabdothermincola salaria]MCD9623599.1 BMP family ABC transporter substrate-binding protein [Rhabdothermincola salaria]